MSHPKISIIIPTHNRPDALVETLAHLRQQDPATDYEIIVVDDGSMPPVVLSENSLHPRCTLVRLAGVERSAARNAGAAIAEGELLIFIDDDIHVGREFLRAYLRAHDEWPEALLVGSIRLPPDALLNPFGRFRQRLEQHAGPRSPGLVRARNFCTAANMAIPRDLFQKLDGFEPALVSSEDQDLALRHTSRGGPIGFVPEAQATHQDTALDIRRYCRRAEWGSEHMVLFCQRYPGWPDNIERKRVNGPVLWGIEPLWLSLRKMIKSALAPKPVLAILFCLALRLERWAPDSSLLDKLYRLLLGLHIFRGYRRGLEHYRIIVPAPSRSASGQRTSRRNSSKRLHAQYDRPQA